MVKNTHSDMFLLCYIVLATGSICVVNMFNMEWPQVAGQRWVPETRQKYGCFSSFRGTFWEPFLLIVHKQKLAEWVAIQSVSAWPEKRGEIKKMMEVAAADIKQLGGSVELVDVGKQKVWVYAQISCLSFTRKAWFGYKSLCGFFSWTGAQFFLSSAFLSRKENYRGLPNKLA